LKVKVRNADILPIPELPGHIVRLSATDGTCPPGTIVGLPDFDTRGTAPGDQDTVLLTGGKKKTATVVLKIAQAEFTTYTHHLQALCTLMVQATTVLANNVDPAPRNNVLPVELNIVDKNDSEQTTVHESEIKSLAPIKWSIGKNSTSMTATKTVRA